MTWTFVVELLGRYSNTEIVSRLERILAGQNADRASDRSSVSIVSRKPRKQKQVRLSEAEMDLVVAAYNDGLTLDELASAFGAYPTTLANRLEKRGIQRRGRRLSDEQIEEATDLYKQGWSLARLGERFDVHPESVRYRLRRAGVKMRRGVGTREVQDAVELSSLTAATRASGS